MDLLGSDYKDFTLVIAGNNGMPTENNTLRDAFDSLIRENDLPKVVFHSLRHSSITYKLKLNGGDVKAVQGDSGHAQTSMVTDVYSHILDDDRRHNAELFEETFYNGKGAEPNPSPEQVPLEAAAAPQVEDLQALMKILSDPNAAALLKTLAKAVDKN